MNIKSCEYCGVLLDIDRLDFPELKYVDHTLVDRSFNHHINGEWTTSVPCPVCKFPIIND